MKLSELRNPKKVEELKRVITQEAGNDKTPDSKGKTEETENILIGTPGFPLSAK